MASQLTQKTQAAGPVDVAATFLGMQPANMMDMTHNLPEYAVHRDHDRCIRCLVCLQQCPYDCTQYDADRDTVWNIEANCVALPSLRSDVSDKMYLHYPREANSARMPTGSRT